MKRYESLDWLRGLMAFAIMIYHLVSWQLFHPEAGSLLGNFGIYGVSIFFVLSGLSMAIVYSNFIKDFHTSFIFFIRRLFRLLPLLWVAVFIVSSIKFLLHKEIDIYNIFINITLLFGFISPSSYINIGAWSIGNEVFYYAFTPILIIIYLKNKLLGNIIVIILTLISFYFSFFLLDPTYKLSQQWSIYIHPLNNFFLYSCGLALYYNFHNINMKNIAKLLIISSLIIFFFYPISGDQINITTNITRIVFSLASVMLTLGFYKLEIDLPLWFSKPFAHLGEATYGIYLLHPIVYIFINKIFNFPLICIVTTCFITIILSNFTYKYYEKPFIKIGKKIT